MLRVTTIEANGSATLKLEGELCGPWVDELRQCWLSLAPEKRSSSLHIGLRDVSYLDDDGKHLLLQIQREGASLVGASGFLRHLLYDDGSKSRKAHAQPAQGETK